MGSVVILLQLGNLTINRFGCIMYSYAEKTEKQMNFETTVINTIATILDSGDQADFSYGTLFVTCTEDKARCIFHALCDNFGGVNKVRISQCGLEYAYDFVA